MNFSGSRSRLLATLLGSALAAMSLGVVWGKGADYGRVSGTVADAQENPLSGATVLIIFAGGSTLVGPHGFDAGVERVLTDAQGRFTVEHLLPGRYSLQVTSPTRLPVRRNSIRVEAGQTSRQNFVLTDIFAPFRFQVPPHSVSTWGDDWKWILRTSATTRPLLRYRDGARDTQLSKASKPILPASQRLIGMIPGSTRREPLTGDRGVGSVLAYLRPLSEDADLLVAGSMTANGIGASSLATAFRKNILKGEPQELVLVVHQLSFSEGLPLPSGESRGSLSSAQGIVVSYAHTNRLSDSLRLTTGLEVDYLNAVRDAMVTRPRVKLEYQASPTSVVAFRYGTIQMDTDSTLLERIGELNAFPRVTLRGYRPKLERLNHAEVGLDRRLDKSSRVEVAAYRDDFQNAAVAGFGKPEVWGWLAGNVLPNSASSGVTLDAGDYGYSGFRATFSRSVGSHVEAGFLYALGGALAVDAGSSPSTDSVRNLRGILRAGRSQTIAGKLSAQLPVCKTRISTSYEWLQRDRVTSVDPYGQASLQLQPYLGIQIRQPLPTLAFLPAHIEALADFRNLLAQGYVPLTHSGDEPLILTPAYRSFRGGFSVQF